MNHHLRFHRKSALMTAAAVCSLALSSCSPTKIAPLSALPNQEITYEIQIFDVPADHPYGHERREILSAEEGAALIKSLKAPPTFSTTIAARIAEKKTLTTKRKFVYPTEYAPPQLSKPGSGSFPVTPATPTKFATTQTGTTVTLVGVGTSAEYTEIDLLIDRKILLGFTNYGKPITTEATDFFGRKVPIIVTENRIEKPSFRTDRIKTSARIQEDHYLVIRNIGATDVRSDTYPFTAKRPAGFIAMIRATQAEKLSSGDDDLRGKSLPKEEPNSSTAREPVT